MPMRNLASLCACAALLALASPAALAWDWLPRWLDPGAVLRASGAGAAARAQRQHAEVRVRLSVQAGCVLSTDHELPVVCAQPEEGFRARWQAVPAADVADGLAASRESVSYSLIVEY